MVQHFFIFSLPAVAALGFCFQFVSGSHHVFLLISIAVLAAWDALWHGRQHHFQWRRRWPFLTTTHVTELLWHMLVSGFTVFIMTLGAILWAPGLENLTILPFFVFLLGFEAWDLGWHAVHYHEHEWTAHPVLRVGALITMLLVVVSTLFV